MRDAADERLLRTRRSLEGLAALETRGGRPAALIAVAMDGADALRRDHGPEVASRLAARLADAVYSVAGPEDSVGLLGPDALGVLLTGPRADEAGAMLGLVHGAAARASRLGVSAGAARSADPKALFADAEAALAAAREAGGGRAVFAGGGSAPPAASPAAENSLAARYQRLLLLNRVATTLVSGLPAEAALAAAAPYMLALASARRVVARLGSGGGAGQTVLAHGDKGLDSPGSAAALDAAARAAEGLGHPVCSPPGAAAWYALPLGDGGAGVLAFGYGADQGPPEDLTPILGDLGHLVHAALRADRLLREQRTLAAVTEQSADPILLADLEGRVTAWSRGAEATFGWTAAEALGRHPEDFLVPDDQAFLLKRLALTALKTGSVRGVESLCQRKDGSVVPVETTITAISDAAGRPFGLVSVLRDISRRKEVDRLKDEFVALVTHDLRAPLTSIRGYADTLIQYGEDISAEERLRFLGVILRESKRMSRMVDDFLDISRLETGRVTLRKEPVDLAALAGRAAETLRGYGPKVRFELDLPAGLPRPLGDPEQLERVLINLGSNAVKYSPEGGTVRVAARALPGLVELSVTDQGPGIPPEARRRLFEKFFRAADAVSARTKGTGLGLAACKAIVEAHGGAIRAEAAPGGTTFVFTLPVE